MTSPDPCEHCDFCDNLALLKEPATLDERLLSAFVVGALTAAISVTRLAARLCAPHQESLFRAFKAHGLGIKRVRVPPRPELS